MTIFGAEFDRDKAVLTESLIPSGLAGDYETHASTITQSRDGTLLAAWFGGSHENHKDVKIWLSRNPGNGWSEPVVADDGNRGDKEFACWNPVLFSHPDGTDYLYYKISGTNRISKGYKNWWGAVKTSRDSGKTWSDRIWLPRISPTGKHKMLEPYDGFLTGPVKNRPIMLPDGRLLCGSSTESDKFGWRLHFEIYQANDWTGQKHGATIVGPLLKGMTGIQPSFLVLSKDYQKLQVLTREDGTASSSDGGLTWTEISKGPINTSKGLHAVSLDNGWHFLAFNPSGRSPLSLARTRDGRNWETILPELSEKGNLKMDYPTIMQSRDGNLHVVHSWGRSNIKHLVLDAKYLSRD